MKDIYSMLKNGYYIRTLHYHNTPESYAELYQKQVRYIAEKMQDQSPVPQIALFDGYRNNYDVMFSILENSGLGAWFLLVTDFIDTPASDQSGTLDRYQMEYLPEEYPDGRYAMSWEEIREISQAHQLINHSATHYRLNRESPLPAVIYEIEHSHNRIREETGISCQTFAWLGGAGRAVHPLADQMLAERGYKQILGSSYEPLIPNELSGTSPQSKEIPEEDISALLRFYQKRNTHRTIFHGVPALLPSPIKTHRNDYHGNQKLASLFRCLYQYLEKTHGGKHTDNINKSLDILAYTAYPADFPWD